MMQMLAAGGMPLLTDDMRPPDEDNPRGYLEFDPVRRTRSDPDWVALAVGKAVKVVHLLLQDLPQSFDYRVILMRRDLRDVLASQRTMLNRLGRRGAKLEDDRLLAVYAVQLRTASEWLRTQPWVRMVEVEYGECLHNPLGIAERVNAFLDGQLDVRAMAAAVEPSLSRHTTCRTINP
jgi:hypothetical protein